MSENPLISVVIPTYKGAYYIRSCLDSILMQTYTNLEIILIDDLSPDKTVEIITEYINKDSRIKVFVNEQNTRSGAVGRNRGVEKSKGEYCVYLDQDDYFLEAQAIEKLYQSLIDNDSDIAMGSCGIYNFQRKRFIRQEYMQDSPNGEYKGQTLFSNLSILEKLGEVSVVPWSKLFKTSLIKEHKIEYLASSFADDTLFFWKYMTYAKKGLSVIRDPLYCYVVDTGENQSYNASKYKDPMKTYLLLKEFYQKEGLSSFMHPALTRYLSHEFIYWQKGYWDFMCVGYSYFQFAHSIFKKEPVSTLSRSEKLGVSLTKKNALIAYFYFGLFHDKELKDLLIIWKRTYLMKALFNLLSLFSFTLRTFFKIFKNTL